MIPQLQPDEAELSALDARMNTSGELGIDLDRVLALQAVARDAEQQDAARCTAVTAGAVTSPGSQTARLLDWLKGRGVELADVARATVEEALVSRETMAGDVSEVLQIGLRAARASNHKLTRMLAWPTSPTCRCGSVPFWCRTNRSLVRAGCAGAKSAAGSQGLLARSLQPDGARINRRPRVLNAVAPQYWIAFHGARSCLQATDPDRLLWSFDFSQIEARVLAWLAGQRFAGGIRVRRGRMSGRRSNSVPRDRQLGKVLVLASALAWCREIAGNRPQGLWREPRTAGRDVQDAVAATELENRGILELDGDGPRAAILQQGAVHAVNGSGIAFVCSGKTLQMRLPSGRVLYYHQPRLDMETGSIVYWGAEVGDAGSSSGPGAKAAENATRAVAQDIMAEAMLRCFRRTGLVPCMTVHDELVYAIARNTLNDLKAGMLESPPWAGGLPLAGEHKIQRRYGVPIQPVAIANAA